ncbi:polysaccharide biosynthesis protein [Prochlorococcus sp. AH-716-D13]|nr:polysaccharide biosynthesis protein [Prochlorococcus sp. AH-716-D13]
MSSKFKELRIYFLDLPSLWKLFLSIFVDSLLCFFTVIISFFLRVGTFSPINYPLLLATTISVTFAIPIFFVSGLYRTIFRYSGWPAMLAVSKSVFVYGIFYIFLVCFISFEGIPRTLGIIQPILLFIAVGVSRSFIAYWLGDMYKKRLSKVNIPRALIYGAGRVGREVVLASNKKNNINIVGFIDDDPKKWSRLLCGKQIYSLMDWDELIKTKNVSHIILAIPFSQRNKRNLIIKKAINNHLAVRTSPDLSEIAIGNNDSLKLLDLGMDDLLERKKVKPDQKLLQKNIKSKTVLITGAGGTIGSQLCRVIIKNNPNKILILDSNEFSLYTLLSELEILNIDNLVEIIPLLASIQDQNIIDNIFKTWRPDTVYHAAAYKHVPIVEHNITESLKNNVLGTLTIAKSSLANQVLNFVFISTDKAVRPTNFMGATKRLSEICLQALFDSKKGIHITNFSMVRFGNVLDSSGSVIPKFRKQIKEKSPITLTHPEITRFFMTIEEAAELVIQAGAMASGGDVFVLDMGEPVRIYDLAKKMIQLSGLELKDKVNPYGDIEILITGLRPGEKLFEELLIGNNPLPTIHPKIFKAQEDFINWQKLEKELNILENFIQNNDLQNILKLMKKLVSGYSPSGKIVDFTFNEESKI